MKKGVEKCVDCLAYHTLGHDHKCFGLMKMLVEYSKMKDKNVCMQCKKKFKKTGPYTWKPTCKHFPDGCMMSSG